MKQIVKVFIQVVRSNNRGDRKTTYEGIVGVGYTKTEANRMAFNQIRMRRDQIETCNRYIEIHQHSESDLKLLDETAQKYVKEHWQYALMLIAG